MLFWTQCPCISRLKIKQWSIFDYWSIFISAVWCQTWPGAWSPGGDEMSPFWLVFEQSNDGSHSISPAQLLDCWEIKMAMHFRGNFHTIQRRYLLVASALSMCPFLLRNHLRIETGWWSVCLAKVLKIIMILRASVQIQRRGTMFGKTFTKVS